MAQAGFATQVQLQWYASLGHLGGKLLNRQQEVAPLVRVAPRVHMRCQHRMANAIGRCGSGQAQRFCQGFGAVVNTRQIMAMQVNHAGSGRLGLGRTGCTVSGSVG